LLVTACDDRNTELFKGHVGMDEKTGYINVDVGSDNLPLLVGDFQADFDMVACDYRATPL